MVRGVIGDFKNPGGAVKTEFVGHMSPGVVGVRYR
jgi:hypothetical protein